MGTTTHRAAAWAGAITLATLSAGLAPSAVAAEPVRRTDTVTSSGVFWDCADGTEIRFTSVVDRRFTTWSDGDRIPIREHRHITFDGTLATEDASVPYTGVWNRDANLITGDVRITGGNFRIDLPGDRTLVGAGYRDPDSGNGNGFIGSGERYLDDLCAWFAEQS